MVLVYDLCMSEPILELRDSLIESLSWHSIGIHGDKPLGTLADYGLMNGGMIVRACGLRLGLVTGTDVIAASKTSDLPQQLQSEAYCIITHVASLNDGDGNKLMATIFGEPFVHCLRLLNRIERMTQNPYQDGYYPRDVAEEDWAIADALDAQAATIGAEYLDSDEGEVMRTVEHKRHGSHGCPLHHVDPKKDSELKAVAGALTEAFFDENSTYFQRGYDGIARLAVRAVASSQPLDPSWAEARYDWTLVA